MTFEQGETEGRKLLDLCHAIAASWESPLSGIKFGCSKGKVEEYWARFPSHKPTDAMTGFLCTVVPSDLVDLGVVKLMPYDELIDYNDESAPLCNFSREIGFAGFAYWTGNGDGDAWVFDLNDHSICSLPVGTYTETYDEICEDAYARSPDFLSWRTFLVEEAVKREWLGPDAGKALL